jgi:recombination protein RecT
MTRKNQTLNVSYKTERGNNMANQIARPEDIRGLISSDGAKKQFALALPKHMTPDRFTRVALTAINRTPKLLQCTKESLLGCLLDLSQLGLEPDNRKAHLIPYENRKLNKTMCTLIIDYKGLVDLARRSGEIADIHADVVCENDHFEYSFGTDGKLVHKPAMSDKGRVIAAYSFVKLKDGSSSYEVMNEDEIEAIHKRSKAGSSGPWVTDWNEMAKKTVFRRHSKWLPVSSEFLSAVDKDFDVPIDIKPEPVGKPTVNMPRSKSKQTEEPIQENIDTQTELSAVNGYISAYESCKSEKDLDNLQDVLGPEMEKLSKESQDKLAETREAIKKVLAKDNKK